MTVTFTPSSKVSFTPSQNDDMVSVLSAINPEVAAKKTTSNIFAIELGLDDNAVTAGYGEIVKNVYGTKLAPTEVQRRMEEDGLLASPKSEDKDMQAFAFAAVTNTDPPEDLVKRTNRKNLINQTAGVFSNIRKQEEQLFTADTEFARGIAEKPSDPSIVSTPIFEDEDLLDIGSYMNILNEATTQEQVQQIRTARKGLVADLYHEATRKQQESIIAEGAKDFTTGSKTRDVVLEGGKGLYSSLLTIEKGVMSTSVAMSMDWNQPNAADVDEKLSSIGMTRSEASGKIGFVARAVSEAIPSFAYNMTVGKTGIFITEYGNAYQDVIDNGGSQAKATATATVVATINTQIESMQIDQIFSLASAGAGAKQKIKKLVKDRALKAFLKSGAKFTGQSIKTAINEGIEGALQEGVSITAPAIITGVYPQNKDGSIDWVQVGSQIGQSFVGEGLGGLFLGAGGALYNARNKHNYKLTVAGQLITHEGMTESEALTTATNILERMVAQDGLPKDIYREELAKIKSADNRHKASAHIVQKARGIGDEQYRDIAEEVTGKRSLTEMNYEEAERFIGALKDAEVEVVEVPEGQEAQPEATADEIHAEVVAQRDNPERPPAVEPSPIQPTELPAQTVTPTTEVAPPVVDPQAAEGLEAKPEAVEGGVPLTPLENKVLSLLPKSGGKGILPSDIRSAGLGDVFEGLSSKKQTQEIRNALNRLKRRGLVDTFVGQNAAGKEVRKFEKAAPTTITELQEEGLETEHADLSDKQLGQQIETLKAKLDKGGLSVDENNEVIGDLRFALLEQKRRAKIQPTPTAKPAEAVTQTIENTPDETIKQIERMSYKELQAEAKSLGLKANQKKDILINRISALRGVSGAKKFQGGLLDNTPFKNSKQLEDQVDEIIVDAPKPKKEKKPTLTLKDLKKTRKIEALKTAATDVVTGIDKALGVMSTRVKNISPQLFKDIRNRVINPGKLLTAERNLKAEPFIVGINEKLNDQDRVDFEIAQWQGNQSEVNRLVTKYNLVQEYADYRIMLDEVYHEGNSVGMDIDYQTAYFPSAVKDFDGLMKEIGRREEYAPIVEAMKTAESRKGRPLNEDEKLRLVGTLLRGFRISGLTLSKPGFAKERTLIRDDISLIKFYHGFEESTSRYVTSMTENIQERKFFGKTTQELVQLRANISRTQTSIAKIENGLSKAKNPDAVLAKAKLRLAKLEAELSLADDNLLQNSVANHVLDLVEQGLLRFDQQNELKGILEGLFKVKGSNKFIHTARSLEFAGSLAQIPAVITQYGEIVLSILAAPGSTLPAFVRSNLRKSKISLKDLGVAHIGQEWVDADLDSTVTALLKPFQFADNVGKETFVNSVIDKWRKVAEKNPDRARKEIAKFYPDAGIDAVLESLKSGKVDNNVKGFALNQLADIQPISKFEVPELFAKAGNLRVFYMYKTFVLKRLDILRSKGYNEIKAGVKAGSNRQIASGLAKLIWLTFMFSLADSSADAVKDFIRGKPIDSMPNYMMDNLLQMILISKFSVLKSKREGLGSLFKNNISLPVSNLNAAGRDVNTLLDPESERGSELVRRIPWIGELYYWYMGEGARKLEEGVFDEK